MLVEEGEPEAVDTQPSSWGAWTIKRVAKWTLSSLVIVTGVAFLGYIVSKSLSRKQIDDKKPKKSRSASKEKTEPVPPKDEDELEMEKEKAKNKEIIEVEAPQNTAQAPLDSTVAPPVQSPSSSDDLTPSEDKRFFDFCQLYASASISKPKRSQSFSSLPMEDIRHEHQPHSAVPQSVPQPPRRLSQSRHIQQAVQQAHASPPQPVPRLIDPNEPLRYTSAAQPTHRRRTSEPAFCHDITLPAPRTAPPAGVRTGNPPVLSPSSRVLPSATRQPPPAISVQSPKFTARPGSHSPHPTNSPHPVTNAIGSPHTSPHGIATNIPPPHPAQHSPVPRLVTRPAEAVDRDPRKTLRPREASESKRR